MSRDWWTQWGGFNDLRTQAKQEMSILSPELPRQLCRLRKVASPKRPGDGFQVPVPLGRHVDIGAAGRLDTSAINVNSESIISLGQGDVDTR